MVKGMLGKDCDERDVRTGMGGKGRREGTVAKGMQGADCGERDAWRGL